MPVTDEKNVIYIYTDGACSGNPGPGGYAALIIYGDLEEKISGYDPETTNNRMEMMAVIKALNSIKGRINEDTIVKIISDSDYVVKGLQEWLPGWKKEAGRLQTGKP